MIEHLHKLANNWYMAVDILSARWLITKRAWQQMMQQISYRKVEFTTEKENYPW